MIWPIFIVVFRRLIFVTESNLVHPDTMKSIAVNTSLMSVDNIFSYHFVVSTERKDYIIDSKLISSRDINQDTVIEDVSQESVSAFSLCKIDKC